MKPWTKSIVTITVVAALVLGAVRVLNARRTQKADIAAQQIAAAAQPVLELAAGDLTQVAALELRQMLAISGSIKAVNSAMVKARIPGELQALTVREGDWVKAGDVIARVDPTEYQARVRQAQQQSQAAKAQVDIARRSFDNNRSLVDQGFISRTALDSSLSGLAAADANYQSAQAATEVAVKSLDDAVLRAPISGQISQRLAQPGERVSVDARVVEIVDLTHLELESSISATESLKVRVGQKAQLTIDGAPEPIASTVVRINPSATTASRAVLVYLSLAANPALRQGLFAQGTLYTGSVHALAVPLSAVRTDKPQPYVQLVVDGLVKHQNVTLGAGGQSGEQTVVEVAGAPEGATLISGTVGSLREGTLVKIMAPAK
jgi:RND family efflux transporter MFP subunit